MAEGEGFEPSVRTRTTVFETAPFDHSGTPPGIQKDIVKVSIIVGQVIEHRKRTSNMGKYTIDIDIVIYLLALTVGLREV